MNGDVIVHRAHKLDDREGPLRILASVEVSTNPDRAAFDCKADGDVLAIALLHFLPAATLAHLVEMLIDAQFQTRYANGTR